MPKASGWWCCLSISLSPSVYEKMSFTFRLQEENEEMKWNNNYLVTKVRLCFLCPTGALQQPGCPPALGRQPQRVQLPPADLSRSEHHMAGRLQPAGLNSWKNAISVSLGQVQDLVQRGLEIDMTANLRSFLHSCSLSLRAGGCGLTVKVSITPTGIHSPPPAAAPACSYAAPVSPPI